jgi:glycosyltransferase involved in cell wall biosynthesis
MPLKIMYLGWLEEYKGIKDFLKAMHKIKEANIVCEIYGDGSLREWSKNFINENNLSNKITIRGWANFQTKIDAFHINDVFILPSYAEGFPNVVIEAMAAGICVISSDVSSLSELINDGENGFIFKTGNINHLIEKILYVNENRDVLEKISINGIHKVTKNHTILNAEKLFQNIL